MKSARRLRRATVRAAKPRKKAAVRKSRAVAKARSSRRATARTAARVVPKLSTARAKRTSVKKSKQGAKVSLKPPVGIQSRKKAFRSRAALNGCSRRKLIAFAEGRMELDEKLDILYHLDRCQKCWDDLYLLRKSKNGRLYNRKTRSYSEADIKALEKESTPAEDDEAIEAEDAFDVA